MKLAYIGWPKFDACPPPHRLSRGPTRLISFCSKAYEFADAPLIGCAANAGFRSPGSSWAVKV